MSQPKPVIVIVPGGFCSPKLYANVADALRQDGFTVVVPALATTCNLPTGNSAELAELAKKTPLDDVERIHTEVIPLMDDGEEVIIFTHSYGSIPGSLSVQGQTVEERAAKGLHGGIKSFVTISGTAHAIRGRNALGSEEDPPIMPYHVPEDDVLHIQEEAKPLFFSDLPTAERDAAWADALKSMSRASFTLKAEFIEADMKIPKTYILLEKDEVINPTWQEMFIKAGPFDSVERLPSGHFPFLSMPKETAELMARIATRA